MLAGVRTPGGSTAPRRLASCLIVGLGVAAALSAAGFPPNVVDRNAPIRFNTDLPAAIAHTRIALEVDVEGKRLEGSVTHRFSPAGGPLHSLVLDCAGLTVTEVTNGAGQQLAFALDDARLSIDLDEPLAPGASAEVSIAYRAERPQKGMHFRTPREGFIDGEVQVWTQGQPEDARHWFPCIDQPRVRATSETIVTVPAQYRVLSNGVLLSETHDSEAGARTFHWQQAEPHPPYLVSVVIGTFAEIADEYGGLPIRYYVPPGNEELARVTFQNTPRMLAHFERLIGVPYPYAQYGQVAVVDFFAGGMENTALSTINAEQLLDAAAAHTESSDWLVAHELAHQWFGNLITCRDWSHVWLNEGFASYFEALWAEHNEGRDAYDAAILAWMERVRSQDAPPGQPVVRSQYREPFRLFDVRAYAKGALVLHMLRRELGDAAFFEALRHYASTYQNSPVETSTFLRAVETASGRGLEQFFYQWLYQSGHPELRLTYEWEPAEQRAKVSVAQTQTVSQQTPLFHGATALLFLFPGGEHRESIRLEEKEQTYYVRLPARPVAVRFDPDLALLASVNFPRPRSMLLEQLALDPSLPGQYEAISLLAEEGSPESIEALLGAVRDHASWRVRARAIAALRPLKRPAAQPVLRGALAAEDARVRKAAAEALADSPDAASLDALEAALDDPASYVARVALDALGKHAPARALPAARRFIRRDSRNEILRLAAIGVLAQHGAGKDVALLAAHAGPPAPRPVWKPAIAALGAFGPRLDDTTAPRTALERLLDHNLARVRSAALDALAALQDPGAIPALNAFAEAAERSAEADKARRIAGELSTVAAAPSAVDDSRQNLEEIREQLRALQETLEGLIEQVNQSLEPAPSGADAN